MQAVNLSFPRRSDQMGWRILKKWQNSLWTFVCTILIIIIFCNILLTDYDQTLPLENVERSQISANVEVHKKQHNINKIPPNKYVESFQISPRDTVKGVDWLQIAQQVRAKKTPFSSNFRPKVKRPYRSIARRSKFKHLKKKSYDICHDIPNYKKPEVGKDWKTVLMWTRFTQGKDLWGKVFINHCQNECEETRCEFTTDRNRLHEASALVFEGSSLQRPKYEPWEEKFTFPPGPRNLDQLYVYFNLEPPGRYLDIMLENYDNFFNWTMTYKQDSDILVPYGIITKRAQKRPDQEIPYVTQEELEKKKMAILLRSNCEKSQSNREGFVLELQEYLPVEIFGFCNKRTCGKRAIFQYLRDIGDDSCEKSFQNYTFFLAFENSLCKDYVTEKLYRSLSLGIIPVTLGAVNYSAVAPPGSFIDHKDFSSVAELAEYMKKVASDATLYNSYFKWKEDYDVEVGSPYRTPICDLCKKLHSQSESSPRKSYPDMREWFVEDSQCENDTYTIYKDVELPETS